MQLTRSGNGPTRSSSNNMTSRNGRVVAGTPPFTWSRLNMPVGGPTRMSEAFLEAQMLVLEGKAERRDFGCASSGSMLHLCQYW